MTLPAPASWTTPGRKFCRMTSAPAASLRKVATPRGEPRSMASERLLRLSTEKRGELITARALPRSAAPPSASTLTTSAPWPTSSRGGSSPCSFCMADRWGEIRRGRAQDHLVGEDLAAHRARDHLREVQHLGPSRAGQAPSPECRRSRFAGGRFRIRRDMLNPCSSIQRISQTRYVPCSSWSQCAPGLRSP